MTASVELRYTDLVTVALPADALDPSYAPAVLAAVSAGQYTMPFAKVTNSVNGHTATFYMSADALKIDGVRLGMGAALMQQVADVLGCLLPTARLRELLYMQRDITVNPLTASIVGIPIASTKVADMKRYSAALDDALTGKSIAGIIQSNGKPWIIPERESSLSTLPQLFLLRASVAFAAYRDKYVSTWFADRA